MEIFRSKLHGFLPFSLAPLTELCSFWYGLKGLFTLPKLVDKVVLDYTIKTDDVGRKNVDLHRWLWAAQANGLTGFHCTLLFSLGKTCPKPNLASMLFLIIHRTEKDGGCTFYHNSL